MIQFNLLPDIKLQYISTQRTKRLVMFISVIAASVALALLAILFTTVQIAQKKHIKDLSKDIASQESTLRSTTDLNKILTIQNQLQSLSSLHTQKPITSRLFTYIQQVTPVQASISKLTLDMTTNSLTLDCSSDTLATANKFADTLKFATYKTSKIEDGKPFSDVVTTLTRNDKKASFTLKMTFDPVLFSNDEVPVLTVPKIISTRSETEKPEAVFKANPPTPPAAKPGGGQ